jgi:hypothetical protein
MTGVRPADDTSRLDPVVAVHGLQLKPTEEPAASLAIVINIV